MKHHLITGIISSVAAALTGCGSTSDIAAVRNFEPDRYMGTWYEIARLPQYFERDLDEVTAEYTLNADGTVKVVNSGVKDGKPKSITGKAKLKHPDAKPQTVNTPFGEITVSSVPEEAMNARRLVASIKVGSETLSLNLGVSPAEIVARLDGQIAAGAELLGRKRLGEMLAYAKK
ncbi:MAG: lipocalin family protein, partial [Lentisphaeria bacterium]|nr:lipocalin family protein [Lentisphaeria bacterium]